jgi:hypothetical protein
MSITWFAIERSPALDKIANNLHVSVLRRQAKLLKRRLVASTFFAFYWSEILEDIKPSPFNRHHDEGLPCLVVETAAQGYLELFQGSHPHRDT